MQGDSDNDAHVLGYLGLGSNIGDRRGHMQGAVGALAQRGGGGLSSSSVYEAEPVGLVLDQRDFFNACLRIDTAHGPEELLDACKDVERAVGREAGGGRHGPRVIDVDVLILGARGSRWSSMSATPRPTSGCLPRART